MASDAHVHVGILIAGILTGGGGTRSLIYVSKSLAPLPPNAGWWAQTFYAMIKNCSGLDPNSAILSQHTMAQLGIEAPSEKKP